MGSTGDLVSGGRGGRLLVFCCRARDETGGWDLKGRREW